MSLSSTGMILRALDRLVAEHTSRPAAAARDDLLAQARRLQFEARQLNLPVYAAEAGLREGEIILATGQARAAIPLLETAARGLRGTLATQLLAVAIGRTAEAYLAIDALERVRDLCAEGIVLVERDRAKTTAPYLQAAYLRRVISLYANGIRAAYELGDHDRMLTWMELSKSRALPRPGRLPANPGAALADPDRSADLEQQRADLERQLGDLSREIDEYRARHDGADPAALRQRRRNLFDRLVTLTARAGPAPPAFDLAAVQAALAPEQRAVSYYWVDPHRLLIVVVSPTALTSHLQPVDVDQRAAVDTLAKLVLGREPGHLSAPVEDRSLRPLLTRIAPVVLPDGVRAALTGATRLIVAPHRALHAVPFAALPVDRRRLIRTMAVATAPNLTCLQFDDDVPPVRALAAGVVDYSRAVPHTRVSGQQTANPPPDLRSAEREAAEVAGLYAAHGVPAQVLLGPDVREDTLGRLLSAAETAPTCVHLALHGASVESDSPLESWLLLAGARLDGIHLIQWRLDGATVVLSACCSGQRAIAGRGMRELPGDDLLGLQRAFFAAGARQVLGALWEVDGGLARPLTLAFHRGLLDGQPADVALQSAIVRHLETGLLYTELAHWAPFFLMCMGKPQRIHSGRHA